MGTTLGSTPSLSPSPVPPSPVPIPRGRGGEGSQQRPNLRIFWRDGTQSDHFFKSVNAAYKWLCLQGIERVVKWEDL
jgi:hypothetical protein